MRKVVHLITGLEVGGAEQMLFKILPFLNKEELGNIVFCIKGHGPIGKKLEQEGVTVHYLGYERWYHFPCIIFRFGSLIRRIKPDILVTYLIHADLFGRVMGRLMGIKKIFCYERGALLKWEFLRYFDRLSSILVTRYLTVSFVLKNQLIQNYHFPASKIEVIRNGIEIDHYIPLTEDKKRLLRKDIGLKDDEIILGIIANLRSGKGHKDLLFAYKKLIIDLPPAVKIRLLIIGDVYEKENLVTLTQELSLGEYVFFLSFREDIPELLSIIDIFVLPTYFEGMSIAILEAMASKKAIITTNIPENTELVEDGISALLISPGDREALTHAMKKLVMNEGLRLQLGKNAYDACVKNFTLGKTIHDYKKNLYND